MHVSVAVQVCSNIMELYNELIDTPCDTTYNIKSGGITNVKMG